MLCKRPQAGTDNPFTALAVNGAKVYIIGRTLEKLQTVAETYGKNISGQIIPLQGDITSKQDIARMYEEIKKKEKCVCILINNAGINSQTFQTEAKSAEEMKKNLFDDEKSTFEDWVDTYRTNGTFFSDLISSLAFSLLTLRSSSSLLHDDGLPAALASCFRASARLLRYRYQYKLDLWYRQDFSTPPRLQRVKGRHHPIDQAPRLRDRQQRSQDPRQQHCSRRLPIRDDCRRER